MCFTNLPIEFDDKGNPYLGEEAEDVDHPDCGCESEADLEELNPEAAYDELVAEMPDDVREHLGEAEPDRASERGRTEVESD